MTVKSLLLFTVFILLFSAVANAQFNLPHDLSEEFFGVFQLDSVDVDQDGDLDVVASSGRKIFWYRNNSGVFENEQNIIYSVAEDYYNITLNDAGDIDNDGDLDFVLLLKRSSFDFDIIQLESLGTGDFGVSTVSTLNFAPPNYNPQVHFQLGDIDNDGFLDILEIHEFGLYQTNNQLNWLKGNGNGTFAPISNIDTGSPVGGFNLCDYDNDGDLDIFYQNGSHLIIQENLGSTQFGQLDTIAPVGTRQINFVDINGDGFKDLVMADYVSSQNTPQYYIPNIGGVFGVPIQFATGSTAVACIDHGDFDNDGDMDILVGYQSNSYDFGSSSFGWYQNNNGSLGNYQLIDDEAIGLFATVVGDFNGNGFVDIIATKGLGSYGQNHVIGMYENGVSGVQSPYTPIAEQADGSRDIDFGDIDSDGLIDVVVTSTQDKMVSWHKNLGGNNWGAIEIISEYATTVNSYGSNASVLMDLDSDGDLDVLTASYWDASLSYYENLGGGTFSNEIVLSSSFLNVSHMTKADMNNDGLDDLLVTKSGINAGITWWENSGAGTFLVEHFVTNVFNRPIVSDLDQDGDNDVIGISGGTIQWAQNLGGGVFGMASVLTNYTLTYSTTIRVEDMNNDGELDLIFGSNQSWSDFNRITVAYNNGGAASFTSEIIISYTGFMGSILVEDFDLDGDQDVLNLYRNGQARVLENDGSGAFIPAFYPASKRSSTVFASSVDFDSDGDQDVFMTNGTGVSVLENLALSSLKASGNIYYDLNNNGIMDGNDFGTNQFGISSTFGDAIIDLNTMGDYDIIYQDSAFGTYLSAPVLPSNWGISSVQSNYQQIINASYVNQIDNDFGIYPTTFENDVAVDITGGYAGCTDLVNIWVATSNNGTTRANVHHELTLDPDLIYASSTFSPDSIVGQTIYWHVDSLFYFSDNVVSIQVATPSASFNGDTLVSTLVSVVSDNSGAAPHTFADSISQIINCSNSVNDKLGIPLGVGAEGYIDPSTQSIEYLIRFQNSSGATVGHVEVRDNVDTNFVLSSIEVISASHPVTVTLGYPLSNQVQFEFQNVNLPSISADYTASKGYVKFKVDIKPNRPYLTEINNIAYIELDEGFAPNTNQTTHTLYNCDSVLSTSSLVTEVCEGELVEGDIQDYVTQTDFIWTIPNVISEVDNHFSWVSDTAGVFPVSLNVSNEYCNSDTSFTLTVHPKYQTQTDSAVVCVGDSTMIFGEYQTVPGIYLDSLQTIHGCDSIVSTELVESALPNVTFYSLVTLTCVNYQPIVLSDVSPPNGQFYGSGIVSNTFDPSAAGIGVHTLMYEYTDQFGCSNADSIQLVVDGCAETDDLSLNGELFTANYNPNGSLISIELNSMGNYQYGLYSMDGKLISQGQLTNLEVREIRVDDMPIGPYFILVQNLHEEGEYQFKKIYLY